MELVINARKLANFIVNLPYFETILIEEEYAYNHIGALFVDITLQSGLNYETVVRPRVQHVLLKYHDADTTTKFNTLIQRVGIEYIINWKNQVKVDRLKRIIEFAFEHEIDNCDDFKRFLLIPENRIKFLELNGVGKKTIDYTMKLLSYDTVAVDRHIYSFVKMAKIEVKDYYNTKKVVEFAADFLQIPRIALDYSIWKYMSNSTQHQNRENLIVA